MPIDRTIGVRPLCRAIDPVTLSLFRIAFGVLMCADAVRCWNAADQLFPSWEFRPPPLPLAELDGLPAVPAAACLMIAAIAAACIAIGYCTRIAAVVFAAMYALVFLWDPTQFNNHHYLIVLLAGWIALLGLNQDLSIDAWRDPQLRSEATPWWHLGIFLFHIALVYGFGAVNKLNADWLQGEPLSIWLGVEQELSLIGPWLAHPAAKYCFAYGGLLFDAAIVPLLCWRRSRAIALALTLVFHLANSVLFQIGPFPWLMLAANVLFLDPNSVRGAADRFRGRLSSTSRAPVKVDVSTAISMRPLTLGLVAAYMVLHVLLPFRVFLYSSDPEWTEEGKNYSWRMMLSHKDTFVGVLVVDLTDGRAWEVDPRKYLSRRQLRGKGVWGNPRHLAAFTRMLRREALQRGFRDPFVKVDAVASLNGRPYQYLVDPDVDLSQADQPFWSVPGWVVPLSPDQPIGDYSFLDPHVKQERIMRVIQGHHASVATSRSMVPTTSHVARVDAR
jgi:vitamin K-dependent gamma-carboxylase